MRYTIDGDAIPDGYGYNSDGDLVQLNEKAKLFKTPRRWDDYSLDKKMNVLKSNGILSEEDITEYKLNALGV